MIIPSIPWPETKYYIADDNNDPDGDGAIGQVPAPEPRI